MVQRGYSDHAARTNSVLITVTSAHRQSHLCQNAQIGQHQVDAQGNPELSEHSILGGTQEGFHRQVLLDPLEKQLDLSAFFVQLGNDVCLQVKGISHKAVAATTKEAL